AGERDRRRADTRPATIDIVGTRGRTRTRTGDQHVPTRRCRSPLVVRRCRIGPLPLTARCRVVTERVDLPPATELDVVVERATVRRDLADRRIETAGDIDQVEDRRTVPERLATDDLVRRIEPAEL